MPLITTSNDIPIKVSGYYDRTLLMNVGPALLYDLFPDSRPLPKNKGDRINMRRYGKLAVNTTPLAEGVTPTGKKATVTDLYATIRFYGDYIILTDVLLTLGLDPQIMSICEDLLADQAAETKDTLTRDVLVAGTQVRYAGGVTARTSIVTAIADDDIDSVIRTLENANAKKVRRMLKPGSGYNTTPIRPAYIAITHTDNRKNIEALTGFVPVEKYPSQDTLAKSESDIVEIGSVKGVRFLATTNAKIWADGGGTAVTNDLKYTTANTACDVYSTIVFGKNFAAGIPLQKESIKTIVKQLGSSGVDDALDQRASVGYKFAHAAKITREEFLVRIESGVSAL